MQKPVVKNNHSRVIDIINWAENHFLLNGFNNSRKEIEWLLEEIFIGLVKDDFFTMGGYLDRHFRQLELYLSVFYEIVHH